ncbi:ABC transporter ATP-binding protein [Salimicrobium halophilum]|uniref:ABC-2 type transport system ATP-binding protein n=1 Tax=Salimicrobium halophilum TaxID=86666 RepID=A0A1G8UCW1_9BACI|nr:ABC transporter ATP-binding protein [Salimicrobium halophilum]SDJ50820.1 ABC-2 type transport system ATP-binding protein [Salimicrobium halophilum]
MTVIRTVDLSKQFGKVNALNKVNMEVKEGEVYGFIGPNGAGKSTTIRILLGMLNPSGGQAEVLGMDAKKDAVAIHRRLAYVPGDVNLWPNLTGGEVIDLLMSFHGVKNKGRKDELIQAFQFDPSKKCRTYSKGNRQKVALIAAFAIEPDLYIFDEPTSGLDPLMERTFQKYVKEARNQGKSILLSSHILSEVEQLCDRVGIIRDGEMIETGTLEDLRHLTRTNLYVETSRPIDNLETWEGVHDVEKRQSGVSFQVDTERMETVMAELGAFGIKKIESAPPTLEDLFMRHYEGSGGGDR